MIGACQGFLKKNAAAWGLPGDGEWTCFFHNNYHEHHSNINLLWFRGNERFPRLMTKVFRDPQVPTREFDNLTRAYRCAPQWVPKPLHCGLQDKLWMLWLQGVPGQRMFQHSPALLQSMVETIGGLHAGIRDGGLAPLPQRHDRLVREPLEALARHGDSAAIQEGCKALAARASAEWLSSVPVIAQHGDLFVDNLISDQHAWYVVDWESFGNIDLPFYDLFTLLFSVLGIRKDTPDQWATSLTDQMPGLVASYAKRLNLRGEDIPVLMPLSLANWFHLQWSDGRAEFAARMYQSIRHYFEHPAAWNKVFGI